MPEKPFKNFGYLRHLLLVVVVAAIYFGAAKLGLSLAFIHANVSPIWPPTGVAIAALLLLGYRIWPGILLGAFLANLLTPLPTTTAGAIAIGNTVEALSAALMLRALDFHVSFDRAKDVLKFVVAALVCTVPGATIGNLSLCLSNAASWQDFSDLWLTWWLGDTVGALLVAPLLLTWGSRSHNWLLRKRYLEATLLILLLAASAMATFGGPFPIPPKYYPLARLTVPFCLWAAFRLGARGVTLATITISAFAIWGTAEGLGPFVGRTPNDSLLLLQVFLGSNAVMFLFLVAAVEERRQSEEILREGERRLAANLAITRILAESPALGDATPRILQTICEKLSWQVGDMWTADDDAGVLRCLNVWRAPAAKVDGFEAVNRELTFAPGVGLPGRVWTSLKPAWISDVAKDSNFPRAQVVLEEGLHAAFAFPILSGEKLLGVMEFFSHEIREPDEALLQMFGGIGSQIGQFMERRQAEESLLKSQEALKLAHKVGRGGTWQWNLITNDVEWSDEYYGLLGLDRAKVPASFDEWSRRVHPDDLADFLKGNELTIASKRDVDIEFRIVRADKEWRWFKRTGRCIYDPEGKPVAMIGMTFDITERKDAEEEREQLLKREHTAREEAELANRTKDEFLAIVSHELRTPLNAMVGWTRMLRAGILDEDKVNHAIEIIDRNAQAQTRLIEDILDVSRIVSGKLRLEMRPVILSQIIGAAVDSIRPAADLKQIRLEVSFDPKVGPVAGDPTRLQQVVWNLLSNAIKFTPHGGQVEIRTKDVGGNAQVTVSDTGEGIRAEFLPHIFDRFRQADSSTSRKHGGLGLGLAIVRHLIELQSGTVEAESEGEGCGAVFTVTLPIITMPTTALIKEHHLDDGRDKDSSVKLTGLRILYVEDDIDSREALAGVLLLYGAEIKCVTTVHEALGLLTEWKPDVLLSDIGLPVEDGYDLIKKVRARLPGDGGTIPAIALSGYTGVTERELALSAGYQTYMEKPIEPGSLAEIITTLVRTDEKTSSAKQ